ncbi:MAG: tetratricopeptide repeat protein [Elusimicrobiota bacterium]|nr:MAG: tetratricopeptide repeat protein [Elusimicrobiota bacterium]
MAALKPFWWSADWRRVDEGRADAALVARVEDGLRRHGPDAVAHKLHGRALWRLGRREEARAAWERALRLDPDALWAFHEEAGRHYYERRYASALRLVDRAIARDPKAAWAWTLRAELRRIPQVGQKAAAVEDLRRAVAARPKLAWPRAFLARAVGGKEGLAELDRAARLDPGCAWIHAWRGEALRLAGRLEESVRALDRALALDPSCAVALAWRGCARLQLGRPGAIEDFSAYIDSEDALAARSRYKIRNFQPAYALSFALRAIAKARLGRADGVFEDMERAASLQPRHGWREGERLGLSPETLAGDLERLARRPASRARALAWLGEYRLASGAWKEALALLDRALAADPSWGWARAWRAEALIRLGRAADGESEAARAIRLSPRFARAHGWRGAARRALGELDGAVADLRRCAALDGTSAWAHAWLGEALLRLGRARPALAALDRAVALDSRSADSRTWRGRALCSLARCEEARAEFDEALRLEPAAVWALIGSADCLGRGGDAAEAARRLERARRLAPGLFSDIIPS